METQASQFQISFHSNYQNLATQATHSEQFTKTLKNYLHSDAIKSMTAMAQIKAKQKKTDITHSEDYEDEDAVMEKSIKKKLKKAVRNLEKNAICLKLKTLMNPPS